MLGKLARGLGRDREDIERDRGEPWAPRTRKTLRGGRAIWIDNAPLRRGVLACALRCRSGSAISKGVHELLRERYMDYNQRGTWTISIEVYELLAKKYIKYYRRGIWTCLRGPVVVSRLPKPLVVWRILTGKVTISGIRFTYECVSH